MEGPLRSPPSQRDDPAAGPPRRSGEEADSQPTHVEVRNLWFAQGTRKIFEGLSCRFPRDRISVVLGASGVGKSTLLRMIGCLSRPDAGEIHVDGNLELTNLAPEEIRRFRRRVGMMFQRGALLDSMTVFENAALPLREHTKNGEAEIREEVHRVFAAVGLADVDALLPGQLSGGMTKRTALARALVLRPELLMCDEPFSGLDPATVRLVEDLLRYVNRQLGVTMIITSHDIASTLRIADHVVLLVDRRAVSGTPDELRKSEDPRVVKFFSEGAPDPSAATSS